MVIGFDIDGVLANFAASFQDLVVKIAGVDKFLPGDRDNPPCWNWAEFRGYGPDIMDFKNGPVWNAIRKNETFWLNLGDFTRNTAALAMMIHTLERKHEVYFVTARQGIDVKRQTKLWLFEHLGYRDDRPTVLISGAKGDIAKALKFDAYIDDNFDNAMDVEVKSPSTTTYLLNKSYNAGLGAGHEHYIRVDSVGEMFDFEIARKRL